METSTDEVYVVHATKSNGKGKSAKYLKLKPRNVSDASSIAMKLRGLRWCVSVEKLPG